MKRFATRWILAFFLYFSSTPARAQITAGQIDDFETGGTMGWSEGARSPNPVQAIATGGPGGVGDAFIQNRSSGSFGAGGRMVFINSQTRWRGNYSTANIATLEGDFNNLGSQSLTMRFHLLGGGGDVFTQGFQLAPGSGWQHATFSLALDDLFSIGNIANTLANVTELRLIHHPGPIPSHPGVPVNAVLGVDNIAAMPPMMEELAGDYNNSGLVEQGDLDLVLLNWGAAADPPPTGWVVDLPDGIIDQAELDGVLLNWGNAASFTAAASLAAVPEPASWWLGSIVTCLLLVVSHSLPRAFPMQRRAG